MSGKKGKKTKGKVIPLHDFLADTPGSLATMPKIKSWADATDDDDDYGGYSSRSREPIILPTAPRAARDMSINEENIPTSPPFVAYISNLPYDIEEEDLIEFFQDMSISNMRLPKDVNKFKGYAYVEFEDRQSLIDALSMVDTNLKNRRVRIEVSNNTSDDRRGRMGRMGDNRRDYSDDPERTTGDWRSARAGGNDNGGDDREDRYRSRFSNRDDNRDSGFEDNKPGNWRDAPRPEPAERPRPSYRDSRGPGGPGDDRGESRDWNRFSDRTRGPPRDSSRERDGGSYGNRDRDGERGGSSFGPRRTYGDDADRGRERWTNMKSQVREPREHTDGPPASDVPRTRPKLALQPRTKPVETAPVVVKDDAEAATDGSQKEQRPPAPAPAPVPATNIFGAAKPVDTAAREREIEERLAKTAEARKEEVDLDKRSAPREGARGRRNGEGREDSDRSRPIWRAGPRVDDNRDKRDYRDSREARGDSRGSSGNRSGPPPSSQRPRHIDSRPLPDGAEKKKDREEDEVTRMPKAKDDQAPNFVASNVYSILPDDIDPDNIEE